MLAEVALDLLSFLSRTLFQLMIPLDFKELARQTDSLALLVDRRTANLPWELLCAEADPLVAKTALVRRLASGRWRQRVRSTVDKVAFVVGNPSTEGFAKAFPSKANKGELDPPSLPGAEAEAHAVSRILRGAGYQLVESIGSEQRAVEIINRLFQRPYRILHIAAHGEFDMKAADGRARSGVLLSDGLMLTAAEVGQMEVVPDLVFLNCCHLGTVDGKPVVRGVEYNKLASSLSRELVEMGVRAVMVAGWAVDDHAGQHFAEVFYRCLIDEGQPFGKAVHEARVDTYHAYKSTNTWGAFQAYGDPGFLIDPARSRSSGRQDSDKFAAPQELVDQLEQVRERLKSPGGRGATTTLRALERDIAALLARGRKGWAGRGDVQYAIGRVYADFGEAGFERAREHYLKAIERGGRRLLTLTQTVAAVPEERLTATAERCALIGGSYKRIAASVAQKKADESADFDPRRLADALASARDWYQKGEGEPGKPGFSAYCALNRLMLDAPLGCEDTAGLARKAGDAERAKFRDSRDYWDAMMPADAEVAAAMFAGTLEDDAKAPETIEALAAGYRQARSSVIEDARSWDSVVKQIVLLAALAAALDRKVLAEALRQLASCLQPAVAVPPSAVASPLPAEPPSTASPGLNS